MPMIPEHKFTIEEIENLRDIRFRRTPGLRLRTIAEVLEFVNDVGFCFAFAAKNSELPCAWHAACGQRHPVLPEQIQHDETIGLIWNAKDELPAAKQLYYGKVLKKRPVFISLQYFPYFYALSGAKGRPDAYIAQYHRGELGPAARHIMAALLQQSPMITADLKLASGYSNPKRRYEFDRGMAELQAKFHVVKIGEFYEPFTFLWELVVKRFPDEVELASTIPVEEAQYRILKKYFENLIVSNTESMRRLLGWSNTEINSILHRLLAEGFIQHPVQLEGKNNTWSGLSSLVQGWA